MVIILSLDEASPALFEAVIVWLLSPIREGCPDTVPFGPNAIPNGSDGWESQFSGVPPRNDGASI